MQEKNSCKTTELYKLENDIPAIKLFFKRGFDIIASFMGLIVLSPIFIIAALSVALTSKGGIFFFQTRIGRNAKPFKIIKFRTMIKDADKKGLSLTVGDDMRITKAGRILRKTKIDELPQLINVLIGDMSFVGPRPEVPEYVALYTDEQKKVLSLRPGITDYASIAFRNENELLKNSKDPEKTYIEEIMPEKFRLNMEYINNVSVITDIRIIFETIGKIAS